MKLLFLSVILGILLGQWACQRDPYREGARLYALHCANCHGDNGQGLGALIPPLAQSDYLGSHRAQLPCILRQGLNDTIMVNGKSYFGQPMPANMEINDIHIANVLNYIQNNWGNKQPDYTLEEVRKALEQCK